MSRPATAIGLTLAIWCAGAAPALAADVSIDLPRVSISAESTTFKVTGTAPAAPPDGTNAYLVVVPRSGSSCTPPGPPTSLSFQPTSNPSVGQVLTTVGGAPVSGSFSESYELVAITGRGVLCAWLLTQDTSAGLVLGATATAPIRLLYRLPLKDNGFPFIQQTPRVRGGLLTAYLGRDHRFTRFMATCEQHGRHARQRFTLTQRVRPDPDTGAFTASGVARPDNSHNYDVPIPAPYHGTAHLRVSGKIVPTRTGIRIEGSMKLGGPGLSCLRTALHA